MGFIAECEWAIFLDPITGLKSNANYGFLEFEEKKYINLLSLYYMQSLRLIKKIFSYCYIAG